MLNLDFVMLMLLENLMIFPLPYLLLYILPLNNWLLMMCGDHHILFLEMTFIITLVLLRYSLVIHGFISLIINLVLIPLFSLLKPLRKSFLAILSSLINLMRGRG